MMACNRIGEFEFVSLHGAPQTFKEHVVVRSRPGVRGVELWKQGQRGPVFTLRSGVDAEDFAAARALITEYKELIGGDPVTLLWSDIDFADEEVEVAVVDVRPVEGRCMSLLASTGGLNPPSGGWIECDWDLVAVSLDEEEA